MVAGQQIQPGEDSPIQLLPQVLGPAALRR
jgi:hypothetical protein